MAAQPYTKYELDRIRKVNTWKQHVENFPELFKLVYEKGANLVLLRKDMNDKWHMVEETGPWFTDYSFTELS